jgi:hypothetical protein
MAAYVEISSADGGGFLLESPLPAQPGDPALIGKIAAETGVIQRVIAGGLDEFDKTVRSVIQINARAFCRALEDLPKPPSEATLEFGLKASAEVGNVVVSKASAEANYTIKLTWKRTDPGSARSAQPTPQPL